MAPSLPHSARITPPQPVVRVGFALLLLWTFFYFSRFLDITFKYIGGSVKIMMPLNALWLIAALLSGGLVLLFSHRVSIAYTAFVGWVVLCLPFSMWIGGSMQTVTTSVKSLLLMGAIISLTTTTRACMRMMFAIGFALAIAGISSRFAGDAEHGRLSLNAGSFSDPNFYCLALIMGMPFVLLKVSLETATWKKILYAAALAPMLLSAASTGSRAGLIALCSVIGVYFIRSNARQRVYLIAGALAAILLISAFASDYVLKRYTTLFSSEYDENLSKEENASLAGAAVGSARGRLHMFYRSIELTLENPIVGVGPGLFARAEGNDAEAQGMSSTWHETHNSYTQVSSETGIPGLIFYAAGMILAFRSVGRLTKLKTNVPGFEPIRQTALFLQLSMIAFAVGSTFLSVAYYGLVFSLAGLAIALDRSVAREFGPMAAAARSPLTKAASGTAGTRPVRAGAFRPAPNFSRGRAFPAK